jgi:hypothetical protein
VAIFVLTSILKELQWQIRIETDQRVDQNAVLAVVLEVSVARIRVVVLVVAPEDLAVMTVTPNRLDQRGKNVLPTTQIRPTPSQKLHQSQTKLPRLTFRRRFECS